MARPDEAESRLWADAFDQPFPAMVARVVGLDRLDMSPGKFADWIGTMIDTLYAADVLGPEGVAAAGTRVEGYAAKRKAMAEFFQDGGHWIDVEDVLDIPWHEQIRVLSHNRPTRLWTWDTRTRIEFERDVRCGARVADMERTYDLSRDQIRSLVKMFRGFLRA